MPTIVKQSARAVLIDDGQLLLIKRTKPGRAPYWVSVGGGVEPEDADIEAALHREVFEELGGKISNVRQVLIITDELDGGIGIQHVFVARLASMDIDSRTGTEFTDPDRGGYEIVRIPCTPDAVSTIDLMPVPLADFICANAEGLRALAEQPENRD